MIRLQPRPLHCLIASIALLGATTTQAAPKSGDQFGDWVYECQTGNDKKEHCIISQTIVSKEDKRRVMKISLSKANGKDKLRLAVLAPLGIHLPSGVAASIDGGSPINLTVQACIQHGCIANTLLTDDQLKTLKNGGKLGIRFAAQPGKALSVDGSLKGVTDGLKAIQN